MRKNFNHYQEGATNVKNASRSENTKIFDSASASGTHSKEDWDEFQYLGDTNTAEMEYQNQTKADQKEIDAAVQRGRYLRIGRMLILAAEEKTARAAA